MLQTAINLFLIVAATAATLSIADSALPTSNDTHNPGATDHD